MKVPAELYRPSDRPYPKHLKSFIYPGHYEVRKVSRSISALFCSGGLTKNSSSFSTPTATQDVTQSVNHQLAPLC